MVDIYTDAAITGTKVDKREGFRKMISDCAANKIDLVITKSISRFARNTVDTLNYVRQLKEKNVAVFFEDENINTMTMDGELLLTVLSSVAQQEVENISANVKKGLKMKMQRGEMVGFNGCLGYDYDPATKSLIVNPRESMIVKQIFDRYVEGLGGSVIARELWKPMNTPLLSEHVLPTDCDSAQSWCATRTFGRRLSGWQLFPENSPTPSFHPSIIICF